MNSQSNIVSGSTVSIILKTTIVVEIVYLHLDLFQQEKYLPHGIEIRLGLNRSSPNFCLTGGTATLNSKIVPETVSLLVRNVELLPVVTNDLNHFIVKKNMKIPIRRVEVNTCNSHSHLILPKKTMLVDTVCGDTI